jgi:predicted thioredoxin/glutaredoxin
MPLNGSDVPPVIVFVTRQGCHLCDEALALLRGLGYEPEVADVDSDDRLHDLYDWRVPVVLLDGRIVAEGKIERGPLERALGRGRA